MGRGYRAAIIALGLTLFAGVAGLQAQPVPQEKPIVGGEKEQGRPAESDNEPGAQDREPSEAGGTPSPLVTETKEAIEGETVPAEHGNYPNCEFNDVQECDLAAQQSMAESTAWMNYAAWCGVALTLAGVLLLLGTLIYTRRAAVSAKLMVAEAEKTTTAARSAVNEAKAANKIAADAAKAAQEAFRQTITSTDRAWIKIEATVDGPLIFTSEDIRITIRYRITNAGKSPATHVEMIGFSMFANILDAADKIESTIDRGLIFSHVGSFGGGRILFPGGHFSIEAESDMPIADFKAALEEWGRGEDGPSYPMNVAVVGCARYMLPGDKKYRYTIVPFEVVGFEYSDPGIDDASAVVHPPNLSLREDLISGRMS